MHTVTLIPGDGIGPEITEAAVRVLEATGVEINSVIFSRTSARVWLAGWDLRQARTSATALGFLRQSMEALPTSQAGALQIRGLLSLPEQ